MGRAVQRLLSSRRESRFRGLYKDPPTPPPLPDGCMSRSDHTIPNLASVLEGSTEEVMIMSNPDANTGGRDSGGHRAREQLLDATPATEQRLMLAGISTAVLIGGDGPPIVLLHGPGEFALTWIRVIPELMRTHRVVVPDLPGHGASLLGDAPLVADRVLAWLSELIEQTCPSPAYLAGHLLGGAIGARFAGVHSDKLRGLVLVDTFGLRRLRPSPMFTLTMINFLARPTAGSRDRFFRQCFVDMNGLQDAAWPTLAATHDIRPRGCQHTESEGGAPKPHAPIWVARHP